MILRDKVYARARTKLNLKRLTRQHVHLGSRLGVLQSEHQNTSSYSVESIYGGIAVT